MTVIDCAVDTVDDYEYHPAANLFPLMAVEGQEFGELVDDIREHGLIEEIELYEGKVIDGRNRLRACQHAGVEPRMVELVGGLPGGVTPTGYVLSKNLHRRQLTEDQRAAIAAEALPIIQAEVEEERRRKLSEAAQGRPRNPDGTLADQTEADSPPSGSGPRNPSRRKAAEQFQTSEHRVRRAASLRSKAPDLAAAVRHGELKLAEAHRRVERVSATGETDAPPDGPGAGTRRARRGEFDQVCRALLMLTGSFRHRPGAAVPVGQFVDALDDDERAELAQELPELWRWLGELDVELQARGCRANVIEEEDSEG
jgi:hypothetical protein